MVEQLERSSAADFGLRGELPYIDAVIAAVNDEANLVEKEHKIDLIRWNEATELATFDYFDINTILSYLARVNIVARWTQLDAVRGRIEASVASGGAHRRAILAAHLAFLDDPGLLATAQEAVEAGRNRWKEYKAAGHAITYWQQTETGGWEQKA